jgi:hypothetical protein
MCSDENHGSTSDVQRIFDGVLRSLSEGRERPTADTPRLLFPNGINYIELKIDAGATNGVTLVVSSEPQKPSGASRAILVPPAEVVYDPEVDPDAPPPMTERSALTDLPWRVAKSIMVLLGQVNAHYPHRSKTSDGTIGDSQHCQGGNPDTSDHCAWIVDGDHRVVSAVDITHDPKNQCDAGKIAAGLIASKDDRIKYVIWNRRIAASYAVGGAAPWAWRPYTGPSPHTEHVHLSVLSEKDKYDSETPWPDQVFA